MAWVSDVVFSMLVLASVVLAASTVGLAVAWVRARERAIRAEARVAQAPGGGDDRLERVEQAVDAIALEVERMSEGQRFVTRLLAERAEGASDAAARPERVATPR
jgi:biopolymer transport protein ExbB/TolQ